MRSLVSSYSSYVSYARPFADATDWRSDGRVINTFIGIHVCCSAPVLGSTRVGGTSPSNNTWTIKFFLNLTVSPLGMDSRKELFMLFVDISSLFEVRIV